MTWHIKNHNGTLVLWDDYNNTSWMHIKDGPYLRGGRKFGWVPHISFGVNRSILNDAMGTNSMLRLFNKGDSSKVYEIDPKILLEFSRDHNSIEMKGPRNTVEVRIIQFSEQYFKTVRAEQLTNIFDEIFCSVTFPDEEGVEACIRNKSEGRVAKRSLDSWMGTN